MQELFARTSMLLGEAGIQRLKQARVFVAGVGGVGSYAAEALARSGVGHICLADHDTIDATNLNRQLHATTATVGQPKAKTMAARLKEINPELVVEVREIFLLPENIPRALAGEWDYIVDAVDTVSAKLALAQEGERRGIPVISAMGAGNKLDPTRFEVADIYSTSVCPLCRVMRHELRKKGITSLKVVYSKEPPIKPESPGGKAAPGSVSFVPGVVGMIAAGVVIRGLAHQ